MSQQETVYRELQFKAGAKSVGERKVLEHHTTADTLTFGESGSIHTNLGGAAAPVTLTLPQTGADGTVASLAGVYYLFALVAANELRLDPGAAGAIYLDGAKQTDDKYLTATDECDSVMIVGDGNGDWIASFRIGTWTIQG